MFIVKITLTYVFVIGFSEEDDNEVLIRREKQIQYGKRTPGYRRYIQLVPK